MRILLFIAALIPWVILAQGSFAPSAGQPGTTAIHKDSSIFVGWASNCITSRGPQDIASPGSPLVSLGDDFNATGQSGEFGTVSLGDGGEAILTFDYPIINGPGWDFAVFENSFDGLFLELAFVEVSSDGVNYFRFPATSEIQDTLQTGGYENSDPTKINNLAGKYKVQYGTPFDLDELNGTAGLNIDSITHVKIIDVIGTIDESYSSFDQFGTKVNDPYPTDFAAGGFDLDAVGVIHQNISAGVASRIKELTIFPTIVSEQISVSNSTSSLGDIQIFSLEGKLVYHTFTVEKSISISVDFFEGGVYIIQTDLGSEKFVKY